MKIRRLAGLVAAALLAAATTVLVPLAPAQAAACAGATGVTVIVDFKQLVGGVSQGCASTGGGKTASTNFSAAGFPLTFVQRLPGFVCRVSGKPASDPCVNTPPVTAYWSLWWSDGKSGTWNYSTVGAGSLKVPTGGYLGFSWQGQAAKAAPGLAPKKRVGVAAAVSSPEPAETKAPSKSKPKNSGKPSKSPTPTADQPSESAPPPAGAQERPKATETPKAQERAEEKAQRKAERKAVQAAASATPSQAPAMETSTEESADAVVAATSSPPAQGGTGGRVPMWVALPLLLALVGSIGGVSVWRGRRTPSA